MKLLRRYAIILFFLSGVILFTVAANGTAQLSPATANTSQLEIWAQVAGIIVSIATLLSVMSAGIWTLTHLLLENSQEKSRNSARQMLTEVGKQLESKLDALEEKLESKRIDEIQCSQYVKNEIALLKERISRLALIDSKVSDIEDYLSSNSDFIKRRKENKETGN